MTKYTAVWIDHTRALVAGVGDNEEEPEEIESDLGRRGRVDGEVASTSGCGPRGRVSESSAMEKRRQRLRRFYKEVMARVKESKGILLLGPGEAKKEFAKLVRAQSDLAGRLCSVKPADRMTGQELLRAARNYFALSPAPRQ